MVERGDPILEWPQEIFIKLYGPLADEETKLVEDDEINSMNQIIQIMD